MRRWRVGTFSMGVSLVLAGVTLLLSSWKGLSAFDTLVAWWPAVFVMIGAEILLFAVIAKTENPVVRYDVFSILFVGIIGCICLGYSVLASTGLLNEVRYTVGATERSLDLPKLSEKVSADVKRIVVQYGGPQPKIDKTAERSVSLFGNYRVRTSSDRAAETLKPDDVATVQTVGTTLYVSIKELPRRRGFADEYPYSAVTVVLPQDIPVELRGASNQEVVKKEQ
ncbi:hypothetical protein [Paenibacillus sp. MBLB4367]|uniref:hypothetical protein n=1 Tax=Paenibacillus sp. MBLB4367 TaxID=3384767 RepID=UPI003907F411